jgi:nicotinate-nucleotide adenylyltransferase
LQQPGSTLFLILGADAAALLPQWYRAADLGAYCTLVVVNRPGSAIDFDPILTRIPTFVDRVHRVSAPEYAVSSSLIRQRWNAGLSISDLVPPRVADYIAQNGLYRSAL